MAIRRTFATALITWAVAMGYSVRALDTSVAAPATTSLQVQSPPAEAVAAPTSNADCFTCHDMKAAFEQSIHSRLKCTDCHQDLQNAEFPHAKKLAKVDCARCHSKVMDTRNFSAHAKAGEGGSKHAPSNRWKFRTVLLAAVLSAFGLYATFWFTREIRQLWRHWQF